jgi:hypothetical protein
MKPLNYHQFLETLEYDQPMIDWSDGLKAIWYDAIGDWNASHNIAQEMHNNLGSWIHAYLHRKEGDDWNAGYWYRSANRPFPKKSFDEELQEIVEWIINSKAT